MFQRLKTLLLVIFIFAAGSLAVPSQVSAQTQSWGGGCVASGDVATIQGLECLIANVFMVIITLIGFAGFVMFIVGSIKWMLSGGNTQAVDTARGTMTYAVVGLVVALSSFIILNMISEFTGVTSIVRFEIPRADDGLPGAPPGAPAPPSSPSP